MNMSPTAALFLLQCYLLMGSSVADPLIDISPSDIYIGITLALNITCAFSTDNHPDMAAFISLVLSHANAGEEDFHELAAITEFAPESADMLTSIERATASGVHNQTGESFLHLKLEYPTAVNAGVYQCSAHGMDRIGHTIELTNTSSVTVDEPKLNDVFEELRKIKMHESSMEDTISTLETQIHGLENNISSLESNIQTMKNDKTSMENEIQTLQNDKTSMAQNIQNLERYILHLESIIPLILKISNWYPLGKHQDHFYYLSPESASDDVDEAINACKEIGELAIINDEDELTAIRGFLGDTSGIRVVRIAGSDEDSEGKWVLQGSDTPLPYTAWRSGAPGEYTYSFNCLVLESDFSWLMDDASCHGGPFNGWRFMCEVSHL